MGLDLIDKSIDILKSVVDKGKKPDRADSGGPRMQAITEDDGGGNRHSHRTSVRKADDPLVVADLSADGGLLLPEQQNRFIRTMIEGSQLLPTVPVKAMKRSSMLIERIGFLSRVLTPATEKVDPSVADDTIKPDLAKITLDTFEYNGLFLISYDALQESIEGSRQVRGNSFESTLFALMTEAAARDVEHYVMNNDTGAGDPFDGLFALAGGSYDHMGAAVDKTLFKGTLLSLEKKFRQQKAGLRFYISPGTDTEWRDELADRGTALGDTAISGGGPNNTFAAYGVPITAVTQIEEDLGAGMDESRTLLTNPRNVRVGVFRDIYVDFDKNIRKRCLEIMLTISFGVKYEDPDGATVGSGFAVA